jgi:hypothetical protein
MNKPAIYISLTTFLMTIYAPVIAYLISGSSAYFQFFAADAFYYLTIAANTSWTSVASFDGINPTNGFHPLWQFFLKIIFSVFDSITQNQQISITFWLSVFFVAVAASLISYSLRKAEIISSDALIFFTLTPGFLYFLIALPNSNYGHIWSYINGMESPLSLFFFSLLFLFVVNFANSFEQLDPALYLIVGVLTSLVILTRLDDVFILAGIIAPILISKQPLLEKIKRTIWIVMIPLVCIGFYMLFNNYYAGSYLPISGQAKRGLSFYWNSITIFNGFAPLIPLYEFGWNWWSETTWRALHIIAPFIIATGFLFSFLLGKYRESANGSLEKYDSFIAGLAVYVILKALYNLVFVGIWHQGHWYYPISIVVTNIIIARYVTWATRYKISSDFKPSISSRFLSLFLGLLLLVCILALFYIFFFIRPTKPLFFDTNQFYYKIFSALIMSASIVLVALIFFIKKNFVIRLPVLLFLSILMALVSANSILSNKEKYLYNQAYENLFNNRFAIRSALKNIDPNFRLLSFDDGIDAYSLGFPTLSGLGFALDREAFKEKKEGRLLNLAHSRGHKWLTTLVYMPAFEVQIGDDVSQYLNSAFWLTSNEAQKYKFLLVYVDPITKLKIISFDRLN